jgi:hypothetical protein
VGVPGDRWDDENFFSNTLSEIRSAITAVRRNRNDMSMSTAIGWMTYVNAHIDEEKGGQKLSDVAPLLPHPAEYYEAQLGKTLNLRPDTARIIVRYYHKMSGRCRAILHPHWEEIQRTAGG